MKRAEFLYGILDGGVFPFVQGRRAVGEKRAAEAMTSETKCGLQYTA